MAAQKYDFARRSCGEGNPCEQGATFKSQIIYSKVDENSPTGEVAIDLSSYTASMQVRLKKGDPIQIELNSSNGRISIVGVDGEINLLIDASDTESLTPGTYKYDLEITNGTEVIKLLYGDFEVVGQITV